MKQEDFEKAKEIDKRIAELTLQAEKDIQMAKRLESYGGNVHVTFGVGTGSIVALIDNEALNYLSGYYYKRHNDLQEQIGELKKEFYEI